MKFTKPDGVIEFGFSGCCCPPGQKRKGLHTNSYTHWWRTNDGPWQRAQRDMVPRVLAEAADTCAEFETVMHHGL